MTAKRSRYAARPITNGSSGGVAQAATQEFKRIEQFLNDKTFPMPGMDNAYNAAAFPGTTDEAKITRAIAQAAADGVGFVWIPKSMFPYTATSVTLNAAVRLIREGGFSPADGFDAMAYGVRADGANDDQPPLQQLLDIIPADSRVLLPYSASAMITNKPINVTTNGCTITGPSSAIYPGGLSILSPQFGGPTIMLGGTMVVGNLTTALVSGASYAWNPPATLSYWFNLRDVKEMDIHGLAALSVECFVKLTSFGWLISSKGWFQVSDTANGAFDLYVDAGGFPRCGITTSAGHSDIGGVGALSLDTNYELQLSWDGTTLRLFVDGTSVASTARAGTLTQGVGEEVNVGPSNGRGPLAVNLNTGFGGHIGPIRISNTARNTSNYTKHTTAYGSDANTLALMLFDEQIGPLTKVTNSAGTNYIPIRAKANDLGQGPFSPTVTNLSIAGSSNMRSSGIMVSQNCYWLTFTDLRIDSCRYGIEMPTNNGYPFTIARIYATASNGSTMGRYAICVPGNSLFGDIHTLQIVSGHVGIALAGGAVHARNMYVIAGASTVYNMIVGGQANVLDSINSSTEGGASATFVASLALGCGNSGTICDATINGSIFESTNSAPPIRADSIHRVTFTGGNKFVVPTGANYVMSSAGTHDSPVQFDGPHITGTWTALSSVAGAARMGALGKNAAITFSATPTFDCSLRDSFEITLTANVTSSTLSNVTPGQRLTFWIKQDATGGRTFVWPTNVIGEGTIDGTASKVSIQEFEVGIDLNAYAVAAMVTGL